MACVCVRLFLRTQYGHNNVTIRRCLKSKRPVWNTSYYDQKTKKTTRFTTEASKAAVVWAHNQAWEAKWGENGENPSKAECDTLPPASLLQKKKSRQPSSVRGKALLSQPVPASVEGEGAAVPIGAGSAHTNGGVSVDVHGACICVADCCICGWHHVTVQPISTGCHGTQQCV